MRLPAPSAALFALSIGVAFGQDVLNVTNLNETSCREGATSCAIFVDSDSCFDCPYNLTLNCPTSSNCTECVITCSGADACSYSTINSYQCDEVTVKALDGQHVLESAMINAPQGGDLTVEVINSTTSTDLSYAFRNATVRSDSSSNIVIIVDVAETDFAAASEMSIFAQDVSDTLNITCNGDCSNSTVFCPKGDCNIDCSLQNSLCTGLDVYTFISDDSLLDDLLECRNDTCHGTRILCSDQANGCELDSFSACVSFGNCTTGSPTFMPSMYPTTLPTLVPTGPTKAPTPAVTTVGSQGSDDDDTDFIIIIVSVVGGIALVLLIMFLIACRRNRQNNAGISFRNQAGAPAEPLPSSNDETLKSSQQEDDEKAEEFVTPGGPGSTMDMDDDEKLDEAEGGDAADNLEVGSGPGAAESQPLNNGIDNNPGAPGSAPGGNNYVTPGGPEDDGMQMAVEIVKIISEKEATDQNPAALGEAGAQIDPNENLAGEGGDDQNDGGVLEEGGNAENMGTGAPQNEAEADGAAAGTGSNVNGGNRSKFAQDSLALGDEDDDDDDLVLEEDNFVTPGGDDVAEGDG